MNDERTRTDADRPTVGETSADDADDAYVGLDDADLDDNRPPRPPIEPEPVDPEHAVLVAVGALFTVAVIVGLV